MADIQQPSSVPPDFIPDEQMEESSQPTAPPTDQQATDQTSSLAQTPDFIPDNEFQSDEEKYGTPEQTIAAGAEGVAKGLFGPVATAAEVASGITTPEAIRGREEQHPYVHGAGEALGFIAPALATLGSSTGVQAAAKLTQAGALSALAESIGLHGGETLASKVGMQAASGLIDNMLLAGGDEVSKMILQDPNQSVQTAVAHVGLAGLLGAGAGAALGGVSKLVDAVSGSKIGQSVANFRGAVAKEIADPSNVDAVSSELQALHDSISDAASDVYGAKGLKSQDIAKLMPDLNDKIIDQVTDTSSKIANTIDKLGDDPHAKLLTNELEKFNKQIQSAKPEDMFNATQELKQQLQEWGKYNKDMVPLAERPFRNAAKDLAFDLRTNLEDKSVWGDAATRQQQINAAAKPWFDIQKDFRSKFMAKDPGNPLEYVVDKGKVQTFLNQVGKARGTLREDALSKFIDRSQDYMNQINKTHANLGIEPAVIPTSLSATTEALKGPDGPTRLARLFVKSGLDRMAGGALGGTLGHLSGIPGGGAVGAMIGSHSMEGMLNTVIPSIGKSVLQKEVNSAGFQSASEYVNQVSKGQDLVKKAARNIFTKGIQDISAASSPSQASLDKLDKKLKELQSKPEQLQDLNKNLSHYMPDHSTSAAATTMNAVNYLNSLRPNQDRKAPLDSKPTIDPTKQAEFNRALIIAQKPLSIVDKIANGSINSRDLTHLKALYPDLYKNISDNINEQMADHIDKEKLVPYQTRIGISKFMSQPLDSTMSPMSIIAAQPKVPNTNLPPQGPPQKKSRGTAPLTKFSNNYRTPAQTSQARAERTE